jgi:nitrate/nitrite-specific signal transduction histidine kinase
MSEQDPAPRGFTRGEELLDILRRGRRFTEELLAENERLRLQTVRSESEALEARDARENEVANTRRENGQLRQRIEHLETRFREVEAENHHFASRFSEVTEENENLANLYVATYRLHSTLDPEEVTEIICEILVELVGADEFGILLLDERSNELTPVRVEGALHRYPPHIQIGKGPIGQVVADGKPLFNEEGIGDAPLAVVPLQIKGHSVGALVILSLLHAKRRFDPVARELLGLLAGHAATALTASRLYASVDRKLRTIEGFMELLKPRPLPARA